MEDPAEAAGLIGILTFGLLSFVLSLSEVSLTALSRERVEAWKNNGKRSTNFLLFLVDSRRKLLGFFEVCQLLTAALYSFFLTRWALLPNFLGKQTHAGIPASTIVVFLTGTFIYIFLFQFFPKRLALNHIDKAARLLGPSVAFAFRAFGWMETVLDGFSTILANLFSREPLRKKPSLTSEEIKMLINLGKEEPLEIEKEEQEMIKSVMTFGQTLVKEIMTPRIDMVCVEASTPVSSAFDIAISHGYSKFPVYGETIDNIIGIIYLKDLFRLLRDGQTTTPLKDMMRQPFFVPESKKVDDLLREMQKEKISMAIIVDEYGGTDGLVTVEDLVEEIVGEIADEHDTQIPDVLAMGENVWLVDGQINLEDLNAKLNLNLPTEEFETLSGYVYGSMGKVPKGGDKIETDHEILEVMVVQRQRISKIKLTRKRPAKEEKLKEELS